MKDQGIVDVCPANGVDQRAGLDRHIPLDAKSKIDCLPQPRRSNILRTDCMNVKKSQTTACCRTRGVLSGRNCRFMLDASRAAIITHSSQEGTLSAQSTFTVSISPSSNSGICDEVPKMADIGTCEIEPRNSAQPEQQYFISGSVTGLQSSLHTFPLSALQHSSDEVVPITTCRAHREHDDRCGTTSCFSMRMSITSAWCKDSRRATPHC